MAVTDHHIFNASKEAAEKFAFMKNFKILHGEEVHNDYFGFFHVVNIGGKYSVNDIFLNEPEKVKKEIKELESEISVPEGLSKREYLYRVWIYREIKKSGGYVIFPHPYWDIRFFHTSTNMSKAIIKNGLCDAFEVIGGCTPAQNNLQVALYNELRAEGVNIPIVGSTDSHSVLKGEHLTRSTVVFSDGDIIDSISKGYSVAVESLPGESIRVYGSLRLCMYTHFLLRNYFPLHTELCSASGICMEKYAGGAESAKELIIKQEEQISEFKTDFFGK